MEYHRLRKEAEEFEAARALEQRRRLFKRLEHQGLVVSPQESALCLFFLSRRSNQNFSRYKTNLFIIYALLAILFMFA